MDKAQTWNVLVGGLGKDVALAVVNLNKILQAEHEENMHKKRKPKGPTRFVKPTPLEVSAYGKEIGFTIDGQGFCDFYESKGWLIGKNPMKDWKAAVRTWARKDGPKKGANSCILCPKDGFKYQNDKDHKPVWLCVEHYSKFRAVSQDNWGHLADWQITNVINRKEME
jgi:hypothetical protein